MQQTRHEGVYVSPGGFIYAIGAVGTTYVKIGSTRADVQKRLQALQVGHHARLQTLAAIPVEADLHRIEKQIHRFLAAERQQGEWCDIAMNTERLVALVARAVQWLNEQESRKLPPPHGEDCPPTTVGERVAKERTKRGWTQQELASHAGVRYETVNRIENGKHTEPRVYVAVALAKALGVTVDYLVGMYEDEPSEQEPTAEDLVPA
jgi:DNA-binding XRE family transcriptional regulator